MNSNHFVPALALCAVILFAASSAWAGRPTAAFEVLAPFDSDWLIWADDVAPPGWPLSDAPDEPPDGIALLPEASPAIVDQSIAPSERGDPDRVLPLGDGTDKLVTAGSWHTGFLAPFKLYSEQQWLANLRGWKKRKQRFRRRKGRSPSRTALIYPTDLAPSDRPGRYNEKQPEPGLTTVYFLKTFELADPEAVVSCHLQVRYKKGLRVYLNGVEVARTRIEADAGHDSFGFRPEPEEKWIDNSVRTSGRWSEAFSGLDASLLRAGPNVLAIEVHKGVAGGAPSIAFDAELRVYRTMDFVKHPYLHRVTEDGVTISWETTGVTQSWVDIFDEAGKQVAAAIHQGGPGLLHEARVRGLKPNTRYSYQVSAWLQDRAGSPEPLVSERLSFVTAPTKDSPFVFLLYGDSRAYDDVHASLARLMLEDAKEFDANLVVHTGDIVSQGHQWNLWQDKFFSPADELISQVPIYPVPGNHELNAKLYYDYFDLPNNEAWYHFRYGIVDFYGVNSNVPYGPRSDQYKWLRSALKRGKAPWKIVFMHHPPYSCTASRKNEGSPLVKHLVPLFQRYGVDLVLLGHDHLYGRSANLKGVRYIISGGGGSPLYAPEVDSKMVKCEKKYHYVRFHVENKSIRWLAIDPKDSIIEEFTIKRRR